MTSAGTDVTEVNVNLAGMLGGGAGDGAVDTVIVNGTAGDDTVLASASGSSASVLGLAAVTNVASLEAIDQLIVDGLGGNDTLIGGAGSDRCCAAAKATTSSPAATATTRCSARPATTAWSGIPATTPTSIEGGDGVDTAEVNGGNGAEIFTVTANGTRVRFDRLDPAPFALDIGTTENLVVNMNGGDDTFSATGNLAALIKITVDGGAGNDTILGSNGADMLLGGDGNDFIDGQQGNDVALPRRRRRHLPVGSGRRQRHRRGSGRHRHACCSTAPAAAEIFEVSANGGRVRFTRNLGNIVMDLDDVESDRDQRARRHRHDHRQRPGRHRRDARSTSTSRHDRRHGRRRRRPTP